MKNKLATALVMFAVGLLVGYSLQKPAGLPAMDGLYAEVWQGIGQTNLYLAEQGYFGGTYRIPSQQWVMICRDLPICLNELGQVAYVENGIAGEEWRAAITAYVNAHPAEFFGIVDFSEAGLQEYYAFMFKRFMLGERFDGLDAHWFGLTR